MGQLERTPKSLQDTFCLEIDREDDDAGCLRSIPNRSCFGQNVFNLFIRRSRHLESITVCRRRR